VAAATTPAMADGAATTVNCNLGKKIQAALNAGFDDIKVRGTCVENVEIRDDDVTIAGLSNAKVVGQLFVNGAHRVTIKNLTVEGVTPTPSGPGILLERGASAVLDRVTVRNAEFGLVATGNSHVDVVNGSLFEANIGEGIALEIGSGGLVKDSTSRNNGDGGITVGHGASARLLNNVFQDNSGFEVFVDQSAFAILTANDLSGAAADAALGVFRGGVARLRDGNTITSASGDAIAVHQGGTLIQSVGHDVVNGSISILRFGFVEMRDVEVNGDVTIDYHSAVELSERPAGSANTVVNGSFGLSRDSGLSIDDQVSISGSVDCADEESSFSAPDPGVVGGGVNCSGF
jgi:hypothetical protein